MDLFKVMVVGAGTMGAEIALACSLAGARVMLLDLKNKQAGEDPNTLIVKVIEKMETHYRLETFRIAALRQIGIGNIEDDLPMVRDMDLVIEAIPEVFSIKNDLFQDLDGQLGSNTIVCTNTSGISIDRLARERSNEFKERFLGVHFFNPASKMGLVEIIPSQWSSEKTLATVAGWVNKGLKKQWVISKDVPNFIVNRFAYFTISRQIQLALKMGFSVEEADALAGEVLGRPKTGIFGLLDLIGLDVWLSICENMDIRMSGDKDVHKLLLDMVGRGLLGRKVGKGFYKIDKKSDGSREVLVLDLSSFTYRKPRASIKFDDPITLRDRLLSIFSDATEDKRISFQKDILRSSFSIARSLVPSPALTEIDLDKVIRLGLGHELGPFEIGRLLELK